MGQSKSNIHVLTYCKNVFIESISMISLGVEKIGTRGNLLKLLDIPTLLLLMNNRSES